MRAKLLSVITFIAVILTACRTDGGDIGLLYGQWLMRSYTIDGDSADINLDDYNWRFQGSLVAITELLPFHDHIESIGTWSQSTDTLTLNFAHYEVVDSGCNKKYYDPPKALGIPARSVTQMSIDKLSDKYLWLSFTDSIGLTHSYHLEKLK